MPDRKKIIERLEQLQKLFIEKDIKQYADDVRDTIVLLKEQEIIEGMIEKARGKD